jgi:thioredoxin-related protein
MDKMTQFILHSPVCSRSVQSIFSFNLMKLRISLLSFFLLCSITVLAQKIRYEDSFEKAQKLSAEKDKILCILFTIEPPPHVTDFLSGLKIPAVAEKFNDNFINYKVERSDTASAGLIKEHNIRAFPSFIFMDSKGAPLFSRFGNMPPAVLLDMLDEALAASKEVSLADYDTRYRLGNYDKTFLKEYINKRIKAGMTNAGPLTDSRTFNLIHMNKKLIDSISRKEAHNTVIAFQTRMIDNTLASAIAERNQIRAYSAAGYIRETWRHDSEQADKAFNSKILAYFKGVGDTARVLRTAFNFYEKYMKISADSIRNLIRITAERARNAANENALRNLPPGAAIQSVSYVFAVNTFSMALNQGAWTVYETGTKDPEYLARAMLWSKRSIELNPLSSYYDTLAHILYRLEFYAEAEKES